MAPRRRSSARAGKGPQNNSSRQTSTYEGGAYTRRTSRWHAPTTTANSGVLGNLATLRDRSRAATRNNGIASEIIGKHVTNLIGTGIKPMSQATTELEVPHPRTGKMVPFREALQYLFTVWTDKSDADGLVDFYGQQTLGTRGWLEGGETFVRARIRSLRDGLPVPIQFQLLEPELSPHTYNGFAPVTGNWIRAGIEFNQIGQRVAYWFHPTRPQLDDFNAADLRRVSTDYATHMFEVRRAGQLRGIPHLTPALVQLYELDKVSDAAVVRQQLANLFVGFFKHSAGAADQNDLDPITGLAKKNSPVDPPSLEPGIFQMLNPGEELEWSKPPDAAASFVDFMKFQLRMAIIAGRIPYEVVTGDFGSMNDRILRVTLGEFRRFISAWQHQVIVAMSEQWKWDMWCDAVFNFGILPIPSDYADPARRLDYTAVLWMPQAWPYLHPVQDVEAAVGRIRAGLSSRQAEVSELGEDAEVIDAQQEEDNRRADAKQLKYDSDGRQPINGKKTTPAPEPSPNSND